MILTANHQRVCIRENSPKESSTSRRQRKVVRLCANQLKNRIKALADAVKMMMKNTSYSLEQAFSILGITDNDRKLITKQLFK